MIGEMEKRFSKSNCSIMEGIQALNPSSSNFLKEEMVLLFAEAYGSDLQDLKNELNQARRLFERNRAKGKETPTTLMDLVKFLDPFKDLLFELFRLCKIAAVLPVSSAGCERSFSTLKLVKTHLRTGMTSERLTHLAVLAIERKRAKALDLNIFVKRFAGLHNNRRLQLA